MQFNQNNNNKGDVINAISHKGDVVQTVGTKNSVKVEQAKSSLWGQIRNAVLKLWAWAKSWFVG